MQIIAAADYPALVQAAADMVAALVAAKSESRILLPTGNTPVGLYRELAVRQAQGRFDGSRLRVFQLDSYLGLTPEDPRSLYGWLEREFLRPLGIPAENVVRLPGDVTDPEAACRAYDRAVGEAGGLDLSVLGLGPNGHLGFNEPSCGPDAPTRVVTLTEESIRSNAVYWGGADRVPRTAMTAGMTVLLAARRTLLLVSGAHKRDILTQMLHGPVCPSLPASYLRNTPEVTVLADRDALPAGEGV